jgi:S1-C subfamily serine protease
MFRRTVQWSRAAFAGALALAALIGGCPEPTPAPCTPAAQSLSAMVPATYAIVFEVPVQQQDGSMGFAYGAVGTAFAIDARLLATNGHVVDAVLNPPAVVSRVLAVQSGTGTVNECLRALKHPEYTGDPLSSPDVGLFTTKDPMSAILPLAPNDVADIALGDELGITGFPGDVNEFIRIIPGQTIPQATALTGTITALRAFDPSQVVTPATTDSIQHQAPTSPGFSGGPIVRCGKVIAANNAGTVQTTVTVNPDGSLGTQRTTAASNNFGIHVKHLNFIVGLFRDNALQGTSLPPAFTGGGGTASANGVWTAQVTGNGINHVFQFQVQGSVVTGISQWNTLQFNLTGEFFQDNSILLLDDAHLQSLPRGIYIGSFNGTTMSGTYAENDINNVLGNWTATRQ